MSAVLEFSIFPMDKETTLSSFVARTAMIISASGLAHIFGPTSCCIEGDWDELMALAKRCFEEVSKDSRHIHVYMRIFWKQGRNNRLENLKRKE